MSFDTIAGLTQERASTFGYTDDDIIKIISSADTNAGLHMLQTNTGLLNQLLNLSRKEISLTLLSTTLIEYIKAKRIPRGLRSGLQPLHCLTEQEFQDKWEGIWNKASLDAMVLTVQYLQPEIARVQKEIAAVKERMQPQYTDPAALEKALSSVQSAMDKFKTDLLGKKLRKFERDTDEATWISGKVYAWKDGSPRQQCATGFGLPGHRRPRDTQPARRHFGRSQWSSGGSESDDYSYSDVEDRNQRPHPFSSRGRQGRDAGGGGERSYTQDRTITGAVGADEGMLRKSQRKQTQRQFYRP
ncbi:hypothetical protein XELAEV_18036552mg [Xenopus laevis]|uniref:Uncharacterized protein n=1 Tax=Xenopus laevis TaxID=8355 RepID=A0A974CI38_XENLA|nr:hypothetical protein XELAEV_18036552mg [Xenopus laevis]